MTSASNPPLPFNGMLTTPFQQGSRLEFNGTLQNWSNGFTINLKSQNGNIVLHFNVRVNNNVVVLNSNLNNNWGSEQRPSQFPFQKGGFFSVNLICEASCIRCMVNGQPFADYAHRSPAQDVKMVEVIGDIQLALFREHPAGGFLGPAMGGLGSAFGVGFGPQPLKIPFKTTITGGLQPGRQAFVTGTCTGSGFTINLRSGQWEGSDIALHFNIRFNERQVVRNSLTNNAWGSEERHGGFPFQQNAPFTVQIIADYEAFRIIVNGQHFADYRHRLQPMQRVDTLEVVGDAQLTSATC